MFERLLGIVPPHVKNQLGAYAEAWSVLSEVKDPRVLASLGPSAIRGLILRRGKNGTPTRMKASHAAHLDWSYPADQPAMRALYTKAKKLQWDAARDVAWSTDVDPLDPSRAVLPANFMGVERLRDHGIRLTPKEELALAHCLGAWMMSQFLHGEQGALLAAAQVTEAVQFFDGKLYGATQVMDEGRHVEVFHRYITEKLGKLYPINDNLFVIIDGLMTDSRWDLKFLGMQIMIEGLALGAFGTLYKQTNEPLLRDILRRVIQDEARHVHYGVLALRTHIRDELDERERREREDWAFEVAVLMRDRFMAFEVYDEWFVGRMSRAAWRTFISESPGMVNFRQVMFSRLVPNLREIGLLTPRIMPAYDRVGLLRYMRGRSADQLTGDGMIAELDGETAVAAAAE